jgi:hypothetical protein
MSEPPATLPTAVPTAVTVQSGTADEVRDPVAAWGPAYAPSIDDFAAIADDAYGELPEAFRNMVGDVVLHIFDFPEEEMLEDLGIEDPFAVPCSTPRPTSRWSSCSAAPSSTNGSSAATSP